MAEAAQEPIGNEIGACRGIDDIIKNPVDLDKDAYGSQ